MEFIDNIVDNSIVIVQPSIKKRLLEYINDKNYLKQIKFMSFNDLKKGLLFDYTNEAINFVMQKYQATYSIAKSYINDLYYVEDKEYGNPKLDFLVNLKRELNKEGLLIQDCLFKNLLKTKKQLYVYGYDYIKKFDQHLLDIANTYISYEIVDKNYEQNSHKVYEFQSMEQEISYVAEKISDLLHNGVDWKNIFIAGYTEEYFFTIKRIFKQYNIPIFLKNNSSLYSTSMGSYFINNLDNNLDKLLYKIYLKFDCENNEQNERIHRMLQNLANKFYWCDDILSIKELIIEEMRQSKLPSVHLSNEIATTNIINNEFNDDDYIFLIGFNLGIIPKFRKDEDYINDAIKPDYLEKSDEYNNLIKDVYIQVLNSIKNLTITYKLSSSFQTYFPSFLIDGKNLIKAAEEMKISSFSHDFNRVQYAKKIDNLIKFGEKDKVLSVLNSNYTIPYREYKNEFNGINNDELIKKLDGTLVLSYSNMSKYFECPFKFYISNILKVNEYVKTLDQFIGSLFHYVLEKTLDNKEISIDDAYDEYIKENRDNLIFTNKDLFFIDILRKQIHFVIGTIQEQYKHSLHTEEKKEMRIEVEKIRKIKGIIKGFVDKILVFNNQVIVIDYKTNKKKIDPDLFNFGLSLQLPVYLYLLKEMDSNIEVGGLYLQHILDLKTTYTPDKDLSEIKKANLRLDGLTVNDINIIKNFDDTYEKSTIINGLKIEKKTGEIKNNAHIITTNDKNELIELVENLINNCMDSITDGNFAINPIKITKKAIDACEYCEYKDICYRKEKDFNYQTITIKKGEEDE